jgi:hypothetical protein
MGWEVRHGGRRYLYRNRRVNGRPVKEYLAAEDRFGFGELMAHDLARVQRLGAKARALGRQTRAAFRERIDGLLEAAATTNAELRALAEGMLCAVGYHRHNRGEWRMRRELRDLKALIEKLKAQQSNPAPMVKYDAPAGDAEAVGLFQKARAGDAAAQDQVRALILARGWTDWLGDLGRQATRQLVHRAAGGDPVWAAGVTEKADALRLRLLGENPSVLEELLVRRVVNGWIATHALELELTTRPPLDPRSKEYLDRALSRAQKRMTDAARELARVRRLQAPAVIARIQAVIGPAGARPAALSAAGPPER